MTKYKVKDLKLAEQGRRKYELAKENMPVLETLRQKYSESKPLKGYKIAGAIHITKETAVLIKTLQDMGAKVAWAGCNPLSTQDDIAAYLATQGVSIYAWHGNKDEYYWCIDQIIKTKPHLTLDDGCDVVVRIHEQAKKNPKTLEGIIGGTEETTTGVHRLQAMAKAGELKYPIIAVNNAETKCDFDNNYGTGEGTIAGIKNASNTMIAGKTFVVAGYGHCGKGVAMKAAGYGAKVIITEINPVQALKAEMDGYSVMPMADAAKLGDIFVTATGMRDIITKEHFEHMKNGAILSNSGHFNVEVRADQLEEIALSKETVRENMDKYKLPNGKHVYLLAEGRLVNLVAAEGHPSEVMDLSFANQVLSLLTLTDRGMCHHSKKPKKCVCKKPNMDPGVYNIRPCQDRYIASLKLESKEVSIDRLTKEQIDYLSNWKEGTE
ncbi:MAG: adenosylhomocysteinase [archaeon]